MIAVTFQVRLNAQSATEINEYNFLYSITYRLLPKPHRRTYLSGFVEILYIQLLLQTHVVCKALIINNYNSLVRLVLLIQLTIRSILEH